MSRADEIAQLVLGYEQGLYTRDEIVGKAMDALREAIVAALDGPDDGFIVFGTELGALEVARRRQRVRGAIEELARERTDRG